MGHKLVAVAVLTIVAMGLSACNHEPVEVAKPVAKKAVAAPKKATTTPVAVADNTASGGNQICDPQSDPQKKIAMLPRSEVAEVAAVEEVAAAVEEVAAGSA